MSDAPGPTTVLVVSFDRWPWPALGCYGHEWIDTPSWDRLAADGFLFDRCIATGDDNSAGLNHLIPRLRFAGAQSTLYQEIHSTPLGPHTLWDRVHEINGNNAADAPLAENSFAQLTQAAIHDIRSPSATTASRLLWVHGVGLPERCPVSRAALELYAADFADEGLNLATMTDDELVDHELTRATALSVLDHWLGELLDAARGLPGRKMICVFARQGAVWEPSPRPTPLIAPYDPQETQVPCIFAGDGIEPGRTNALLTTDDLFSTLGGWVGVSDKPEIRETAPVSGAAKTSLQPPLAGVDLSPLIAGEVAIVRSSILHGNENHGCLWTADDLTLFARNGDDWTTQRYLHPDDGWAIHDVATQTPDVTAERLAQFRDALS